MLSTTKNEEHDSHQASSGFDNCLDCFKDCSLSTREIFKIFVGPEKELPVELPPSTYLIELKRSHEERQALLKRHQVFEKSKEFKGELEVIPNVIVFQNWHADKSFSVKFTISNRLKNPLDVNVYCDPSPHFSIASRTATRRCKLANGITTPFTVIFLPDARRDYQHKLTITTSFSKIIVPIIAIGPRPILDFPDKLDFGETPVKVFVQRVLTISNVGDAQAAASLITESPFEVSPKNIYLQPSQSCALMIVFCSNNPGLFFGTLKVCHDNGDEMVVKLVGIAGNSKVWLEKESVEFADTYIGTKVGRVLKIFNETDHVLSFKWLKNPSSLDDVSVVLNMQGIDASIRSALTGVTVDYYASEHNHQVIMDRVHLDGAKQVQQERELFFKHINFDINPIVGEVNPHSERNISILFGPTEAIKYSTKAYCEVEGADRRFSLELRGTGQGPDILVNVDVIDFDLIFLNLEQSYELVFSNLGLIKGKVKFREPAPLYGGTVSAYPDELNLDPADSHFMCIRFVSSTIGSFLEEMFFDVIGSNKAIRVIIKGKVVSPLVTFDRTYLDFGRVAFGFPISQTIRIENKSPIPATFRAVVPDDGDQPVMPVWNFGDKFSALMSYEFKSAEGTRPQEFKITPTSGVLIPHGSIYLEISLTPNIARECYTTLQIWLRDIEYEELTIPIHFIACQAKLTASPPIIVHRYAFIGFPYAFDLTLENEGETPLFFFSASQPVESEDPDWGSGIRYALMEESGIINANSSVRIILNVIVLRLGKQEDTVMMNIFGHPEPLKLCTIIAYGIGPSVTAEPYSLSWKEQPIGTPSTKELTLRNICPVPAHWSLRIEVNYSGGICDPKPWTLSQEEGLLQPYDVIVIEVTAFLIDMTKVVADLILDVSNSTSTNIKLIGKGIGTSIVFEPPLMDSWDFGDIFINELFAVPILVKNIGTLHHRVIFTHKKLRSSDMASSKSSSNKGNRLPIEFSPDRMDLGGCESQHMQILLQSNIVGQCSVDFYLYATINRKGKRMLIGQSTLKANFIFPLLVVNPRILNFFFRLENLTTEIPAYITGDVKFWTTTLLPTETVATVKPPFTLVSSEGACDTELFFQVSKEAVFTKVKLDLIDLDVDDLKKITGLLTFTVMNKYKTRVPLKAAVLFPYLSFNESEVNLGSSEPYVALYSMLHLKNLGNLPITFRWKLVVDSFRFIDVMCPELSRLLESEDMKRAMTMLDKLPTWTPKETDYDAAEDTTPVNSAHIARRFGVLNTSKTGLAVGQKSSTSEKDVFKINAHAIVTALVPILNNTLLPALITGEKGNLPSIPQRDEKPWDLDLVPSYGTLPSQDELITNAFVEPDRLGIFVGDAVCEVENGLSETITFVGACGPPFYKLEPSVVDFGPRKFCELWTTTFKIINIGWTSFYYEINIMYKDHLLEYSIQPRCFSIAPSSKLVGAGEEVEVKVTFYPAVTGPIKKHFLLTIGSAPPVKVPIKGFATLPQLLINCPLEDYDNVPEETKYSAIGRQLCNEWFCPFFMGSSEINPVLKTIGDFQDQHVCLELPGPASFRQDFLFPFEEGWVIITANNFVPTASDITLATERELCHDYYHYLRPKMLRHMMKHYAGEIEKEKPFPYLLFPGYKMDIGPVIIGSEAYYDMIILNPGPLDADFKIRLPFKNKVHLAKKGITFDDIEAGHLQAGESITVRYNVLPTHKLYKNLDADCLIEFVFYIEVGCGGKIPVHFTTTITYPYLSMKKKIVFGKLKCGQKKLVYFLVKNSGLVPVSWQCSQRNVRKRRTKDADFKFDEMESCFSFSPSEGFLEPQSYMFMSVEFLPTRGGKFERVLEFNILNREQPQLVRLVGEAVEPLVDISFGNMDFVSVVPFSLPAFKDLTATNNTDSPLEVFFPEYDYDICEEEKIFSTLCHYYGVPNVFIPIWCYDTSMTADLKNIYYRKLGALADAHYIKSLQVEVRPKEERKTRDWSRRSKMSPSRSELGSLTDGSTKTRKGKGKKKTRSSVVQSVKNEDVILDKPSKEVAIKEVPVMEPSLDEKISTYLNYLNANPDISRKDLFQADEEPASSEAGSNKLIFFGGGPNTDYKYWAKYMARRTKLLYMTVDELILYAASLSPQGPAATVRKAVNDVYCRVVMNLDPVEHGLLDQFDPLSDVDDILLDLLTKVTAIEKKINDSKEAALKAKEKARTATFKKSIGSKKSQKSKSPGTRKSKSGRRQSKRASQASSHRKSRSASAGSRRKSAKSVKSMKSQKSAKSRRSVTVKDDRVEKSKTLPKGTALKLDLDKPVLEDLSVDLLFDLIKDHLQIYVNYPGVVLDYMRGFFIRDSVLAMTIALKAVYEKKFDLRCIDLHSSLAFHRTIMENRRRAEEKRKAEEFHRKVCEIDKMDGYKFHQLDEETKFFYIEEVKKRDEMVSDLAINGVPIHPDHGKHATSKVRTPSSKPGTTVSSTGQSSKFRAGTSEADTASNDENEEYERARKTSSAIKTKTYVSRIAQSGGFGSDGRPIDDDMYILWFTYDKEMQAIRNIVENFSWKNPFWSKEARKSDEQEKKTKKSKAKTDSKGKEKGGSLDTTTEKRRKSSVLTRKVGFPYYALHTVPWGMEKDLEPLMSYMVTLSEFQGVPVVKKPWDEVEVPEPVTYFWLMQPLYGIGGEDEEFAGFKSSVDHPTDPATTETLEAGHLSDRGSSARKSSLLTPKASKTIADTTYEVLSLDDEPIHAEEEVGEEDIKNKDMEEQEPPRKHENADPLTVGLLHSSNLANEKLSLAQLRNELFRINPELPHDYVNPMVDTVFNNSLKLYDDTISMKSRRPSKTSSPPMLKKSHASTLSFQRTLSEEGSEEFEKVTIPELVELEKFHIYGVSLAVGAEGAGPGVRVLLQPGESATWKVVCSTRMCGTFEKKFLMEVGGWQKSLVAITCHVVSGIPSFDTDPYVLYCSVSERAPAHCPTYYLDRKVFDFGPVLSSKGQPDPRVFQVGREFRIVNNSGVVIEEIGIIFDEYDPTPHFTFEPTQFSDIKPGEVRILRGYAHPISHGTQEGRFWYYIKNNPMIGFLHLKCQGKGGKISYTSEDFQGNKVLLLRSVKRTLRLENTGTGLYWEITNLVELGHLGVRLSHSKGTLKKGECHELDVVYRPLKPGLLSVKLKLAVYNLDKKGAPIQTEEIPFSVEGVDIAVSLMYKWRFANRSGFTTKDHLDCGRAVVGDVVSRSFIIASCCNDDFKFEIVNRKKLKCEIECSPESGNLNQGKKMLIDVNVTVTCPVRIKREPVMDVNIIYMQKDEPELVAMIPILLSLYCKSSHFSFYPSPELDFGIVEVNSFQERKIVFENLGDGVLDLAIMTVKQLQILMEQIAEAKEEKELLKKDKSHKSPGKRSQKSSKRSKVSRRASKRASKAGQKRASKRASKAAVSRAASKRASKAGSRAASKLTSKAGSRRSSKRASKAGSRRASKRASKAGSKKGSKVSSKAADRNQSSSKSTRSARSKQDRLWFIDKKPFEIGAFTVSSNGLTIPPLGRDFVTVSCTLKRLGQTEETLVICSPDIIRDRPEKGVFYPLRAVSAVPNVDFSSPNILYPDMFIVSKEDKVDISKGEPIGIYNKDTNTIIFYNVALNQPVFRTVVLTNVGFIDAAVQVWVEELPSEVNKENAFGLNEDLTKRETVVYTHKFGHESFHVYFSPSALETVRGLMKFNLITNIPGYSLTHEVYLEGQGVLPEISVLQPFMTEEMISSILDFGSCALEFTHTRNLIFKNTGTIVCTVLFEIANNYGGVPAQNPFALTVSDEVKKKYLRPTEPNLEALGPTTKFIVPRGHEVELNVSFTPASVSEVYESALTIHTVYNPYVIRTIKLIGVGSSDWLSFRGIPLVGSKEEETAHEEKSKKPGSKGRQSMASKRRSVASGQRRDRAPSAPSPPEKRPLSFSILPRSPYNEIDFGRVPTGVIHKYSFELVNSSAEPCKFSWESHRCVRMIPSEGHVLPKMSKQCYAVLTSEEPVDFVLEPIKCTATAIVYDEMQTDQWDNEQRMVQWISSLDDVSAVSTQEFLKKKEFPYPEPPHKTSPSGQEKSSVLYVKGSCDVPNVALSAESVNMNTAFLYQKEETVVDVINLGLSPAEVTWNIKTTSVAGVSEMFGSDPAISTGPLGEGEYPGIIPRDVEVPMTPGTPQKKLPPRPGYIYPPTPMRDSIVLQREASIRDLKKEFSDGTKGSWGSNVSHHISKDPAHHSDVFFVTPRQGVIPANESASFKFIFIPKNPLKYYADATLEIKGLPEPKVLSLSGIGRMSSCHVEVSPSDYLSAGRRSPNVEPCYDYDPSVTVIEMRIMGVGIICRKRFTVMNPTEMDYHYQWHLEHIGTDYGPETDSTSRNPPFLCCTKFGLLPTKQKQQMLFEFRPKRAGTIESFWTLGIQELSLKHGVLIVGIVTEPKVVITPEILQLRPTLRGIISSGDAFLENTEDVPITYSIDPKSLICMDDAQGLEAQPSAGTVNPHECQLVRFTHNPDRAGEETFLVRCDIKRRSEPLELTVRTICYQVELQIKYKFKNETGTLYSFFPNTIKLGRMYERIPCQVEFTFLNTGIPPWYFHCEPDDNISQLNEVKMSLPVASGLVLSKGSKTISLSITATKRNTFTDIPFTIKITKGPEYNILFCGTSAMPVYKFSFLRHDFGQQILLKQYDKYAYCVDLIVTNMDDEAMVLAKTSEDPEFLCVDLLSCVIQPRSRVQVPISFIPLTPGIRETTVHFIVNDVKEETVLMKGEGVRLDVHLKNGKDETIDFGIVEANHTVRREVEITNSTRSTVPVRLEILTAENYIAMVMPKSFEMSPNSTVKFEVSLTPMKRGAVYTGDITLYHFDDKQVLLSMKCLGGGYDFSLNRQHVPFPAVIIGSSVVEHVCLINQGEYPARYEWKMDLHVRQLFNIVPQKGNSNPGSSLAFEITFYPTKLFKSITSEVRCLLSNGQSLPMKLSGACLELPPSQEVIEFRTPVRKELMKTITLENKTYTPWTLFPVLSGKYFSGVDRVEIIPNGKYDYEVEYYPLLSTTEVRKHTGSVFFSFPDGRCVLYAFLGETDPPEQAATLLWTVTAKEETPKSLEVENWLYEPQRMRVAFSRTDNGNPETFIIQGPEYIDLPPKSLKTYEVALYAFQEGVSVWKVAMINEVLNETVWYSLTLNVRGTKILEKFTLETNLRVPVVKSLTFENPLTSPANVTFTSPTSTLRMLNGSPVAIPATEVISIELEYLPLIYPSEYTEEESVNYGEEMEPEVFREAHSLEFESPQLGKFLFEVVLLAHPALPEPRTYVEAHVSTPAIFGLPIKVFSPAKASFDFQSTFQDIWLLKDGIERLPDKQSLLAKCIYSPSQLGKFNCKLTFFSPETGTYTFPVVATGLSPKPMGPILFETGQSKSIAFQNIFPENQTFTIRRTNMAFEIDSETFSLDPNEVRLISVTMVWAHQKQPGDEVIEPYPIAAQLTVVPDYPPRPGILWVFYLKGTNKEVSEIIEGDAGEGEVD